MSTQPSASGLKPTASPGASTGRLWFAADDHHGLEFGSRSSAFGLPVDTPVSEV